MQNNSFERPSFQVTRVEGGNQLVHSNLKTLEQILLRAFADLITPQNATQYIDWFDHQVLDYQVEVFLLSLATQIVGYTVLTDANIANPFAKAEREEFKLNHAKYLDLQERTAEVGFTAIDPTYQHQGGWSKMMIALEEVVIQNPKYVHMTRWVRRAHGYADRVKARYEPHIIFERDYNGYFEDQKYFRIRLAKEDALR